MLANTENLSNPKGQYKTHLTNPVNTQYLRNPTMIHSVKMEYVSKITIFGKKTMVKSDLEKKKIEIPPCGSHFLLIHFTSIERRPFLQNYKCSCKNDLLCEKRDFKKIPCGVCT